MPTATKLDSDIRQKIDRSLHEARKIVEDAVKALDDRIEELTVERDQLAKIAGAFGDTPRKRAIRQRVKREAKHLDPHQQAGRANIEKAEEYLRANPRAFASDVIRATGIRSGNMTWVVRALAADKKIRLTGEKRNGSPEVEYLPDAPLKAIDGGRAKTRRRKEVPA